MKLNLFLVPVIIVLLVAGCGSRQAPTARNVKKNAPAPHISEVKKSTLPTSPETIPALASEVNMASALALALNKNPSLSGYSAEIRARDAAVLQAGLLPNPEIGIDVENFGGKGSRQSFDEAETTIAFSQLVELGGKRGNRHRLAVLDKTLAEWDYQSKKLDILAATAKAFIAVLIAQDQVALNDELLKLAEQTTLAVSEKADAGKVSPLEKSRAQIELAAARTEANKAIRELEAAKRRLAGFWGSSRADFARVTGKLDKITALPDEESLKAFLESNPDLAKGKAEIERSKAALSLAQAEAVPDVTLSVGVRNFQDTNDNAFLVGFSMPLPFFNRNQGGISEAQTRIGKAQSDLQAAEVGLLAGLSDTWQSLSAAYAEATSLRDEILPNAQASYESTKFGYIEGKLDFLQMLDAQRTLFTVKRQYLLSLETYHLANIDMERLIGMSLRDINKADTDKAK